MFINKDSIKINNTSMGQYLVDIKYGYHKQWGSDTGRNTLDGSFSGTFKGIFPKFTLQFRKLTQNELEMLAPIFDSASQQFTYYDPNLKIEKTITTYSNDWEVVNDCIINSNHKNKPFSVAFISKDRR